MTHLPTAMSSRRRFRRTATGTAAVLAAVGLVLAGCSSSKKSSSVAALPSVTQAPTTAPAPTTVAPSPTTSAPSPTTTAPSPTTTSSPTTTPSAAPTTTAASSAAAATPVTATEKEYVISLSRTTFTPGSYTFTIKNVGTFKHDLVFNGPGLSNTRSAIVLPGATGSLTVTLASGTYDVYCGVPTHKAKGMDLHITVA